ncbi:hypothetical protein FOA52_009220 [Chlamydomonas sp. UWO 241]|nr:hypothetical protein FOA52_009220 [Chlamydomonas sp. UWO 241]
MATRIKEQGRLHGHTQLQAQGSAAPESGPSRQRVAPESGGGQPKQCSSSCYISVSWSKASSSWRVHLRDRQSKRSVRIGNFASEEHAARAYERAAVQEHRPGVSKR